MKIGILGTGIVARTLAAKLAEREQDVMLGTRNVARTMERTADDVYGNPPFRVWLGQHPDVKLGTFAETAEHGELVVHATAGAVSLEALNLVGEEHLDGKVLVDVSNPLDFSRGFPPSLTVCNTDSLAEQIQRAFPRARVVKTLNTTNAYVMVNPREVADGDHHVFMSGNDAEA
ncbi:MAG TPA: NAD(P)-binding domain-containing protein, partial [Anaerolineae bacterium]|nr:NAD(P)-binding domain-containing protein [Anaerolineae bacterium]